MPQQRPNILFFFTDQQQIAAASESDIAPWGNLCLVLVNLNRFLYVE